MKKFKEAIYIALLVFIAMWLFWYFSGGPQRSQNVKPYVKYDYDTGKIENSNTDLGAGIKDMTGIKAAEEATTTLKNIQNLNSTSSTSTSGSEGNKQ